MTLSPSRSTATNMPPRIVGVTSLTCYTSSCRPTSQRVLGIGPTFHWTELSSVCIHKRKSAAFSPTYRLITQHHCSTFNPIYKRYVSIRATRSNGKYSYIIHTSVGVSLLRWCKCPYKEPLEYDLRLIGFKSCNCQWVYKTWLYTQITLSGFNNVFISVTQQFNDLKECDSKTKSVA